MSKTILQVCPSLNSGGIERGTVDVAIALKARGFRSIVISGGGKLESEIASRGVEHYELPLYEKNPIAIKRHARLLREIITNDKVDLVHARSRAPTWATYHALKKLPNVHFITSCHSPHGPGFLGLKKHYNRVITYGERVIAISQFIANYLQKNYHLPQDKIDVIYRGIDTAIFNPDNFKEAKLASYYQRFHLPTDKPIILMPGRITPWKGQLHFLQALTNLKATDYHAVIVGRVDNQPYDKQLKLFVTTHRLEDKVTFIDENFEIPALFALADIAISASMKPEAFGRVAVESQAMHCITIATNLGAANETVVEGKTGYLIPAHNPLAMAEKIDAALSLDAATRQTMQTAARERVVELFSRKQMVDRVVEVYERCLGN